MATRRTTTLAAAARAAERARRETLRPQGPDKRAPAYWTIATWTTEHTRPRLAWLLTGTPGRPARCGILARTRGRAIAVRWR